MNNWQGKRDNSHTNIRQQWSPIKQTISCKQQLLDELSKVVSDELKFKLQFTEKSFDDHYLEELKSIVYERSTIYNNSDYLELKTNFELNWFRLEDPFNYVYIDNDKNIQNFLRLWNCNWRSWRRKKK